MPAFPDIDALNAWLEAQCIARVVPDPARCSAGNHCRCACRRGYQPDAAGAALRRLRRACKRVSPTCLISFERNRYSVPASFANRPVSVRIYPERIVVAAEGQILCEHERVIQRSHDQPGRTIYDWRLRASPCPRHGCGCSHLAVVQRGARCLARAALPSSRCPQRSGSSRVSFCDIPAATGRWWRYYRWSCTMTNRPCCAPWNWRSMPKCQPRPIGSVGFMASRMRWHINHAVL